MIGMMILWSMNSLSFTLGIWESLFSWGVLLAFVISLQSLQGCFPENVFSMAVESESMRAKS